MGSTRRYFYDLALTGIHTIRHEGWRSFARKVRVWFRERRLVVINRLLPWGTRRRYLCDLVYTGIRTIRHEGWRSFARKVRIWFRLRRAASGKPAPLPQLSSFSGISRWANTAEVT